jgi:hypothetical protein
VSVRWSTASRRMGHAVTHRMRPQQRGAPTGRPDSYIRMCDHLVVYRSPARASLCRSVEGTCGYA